MNLYIRPMYSPGDVLTGFTVTTCQGKPLVDSEILEHFPVEASGREIREAMQGQYPNSQVQWGTALCTG